MADAAPFTVNLGDDTVLVIPVDVPGGAPANIDPSTPLVFGYGLTAEPADRVNADKPSARPQWGTWPFRGVEFPAALVLLGAAETSELPPYTEYHWACRALVNGSPEVIQRGTFRTAPVPI